MINVAEEMKHLHKKGRNRIGTLGTLKGVRPVWGRLSRNLHSKESKARLFQSIENDSHNFQLIGRM
jgi:hypothetical protein